METCGPRLVVPWVSPVASRRIHPERQWRGRDRPWGWACRASFPNHGPISICKFGSLGRGLLAGGSLFEHLLFQVSGFQLQRHKLSFRWTSSLMSLARSAPLVFSSVVTATARRPHVFTVPGVCLSPRSALPPAVSLSLCSGVSFGLCCFSPRCVVLSSSFTGFVFLLKLVEKVLRGPDSFLSQNGVVVCLLLSFLPCSSTLSPRLCPVELA